MISCFFRRQKTHRCHSSGTSPCETGIEKSARKFLIREMFYAMPKHNPAMPEYRTYPIHLPESRELI
jgi:hypothetical protein